jgi:hypothetical protein
MCNILRNMSPPLHSAPEPKYGDRGTAYGGQECGTVHRRGLYACAWTPARFPIAFSLLACGQGTIRCGCVRNSAPGLRPLVVTRSAGVLLLAVHLWPRCAANGGFGCHGICPRVKPAKTARGAGFAASGSPVKLLAWNARGRISSRSPRRPSRHHCAAMLILASSSFPTAIAAPSPTHLPEWSTVLAARPGHHLQANGGCLTLPQCPQLAAAWMQLGDYQWIGGAVEGIL